MTFWEVLFNVIAFAWSPTGIFIWGFLLFLLFGSMAEEEYRYGSDTLSFWFAIACCITALLTITFAIWAFQANLNPFGWHLAPMRAR